MAQRKRGYVKNVRTGFEQRGGAELSVDNGAEESKSPALVLL
jgi:hypothetical protein